MKNNTFISILAFFLIICTHLIQAQTKKNETSVRVDYYKVSEVRIFINHPSDISELRKQGLGFESIKLQDTYFDVLLDSFQINTLIKSGYPYKIIIDDVTKDYIERTKDSGKALKSKVTDTPLGFGYGSMGGFYTFSEVVEQLDSMRIKYPNLITAKDSIGTSIEGRTIWAVKISDNPDIKENEPEIFYNALTHACEPVGMMAVMYYMNYLLENYGTDAEVTYLVNNREMYFVPVINPDVYAYNEKISSKGGGMWYKTRSDNGNGIFGVNINNNFGYRWAYDNIGSSPDPKNPMYRGTDSFSEPETKAVREFCIGHHFIISNSFHSYMPGIFPPWGYIFEQTPDSSKFNSLIKLASAINNYPNGLIIPVDPIYIYTVNGYSDDWMYGETSEKNKIFAITTEASNPTDESWPKPERITPLAVEHLYSNLVYAWGPGIIENPPYISNGSINHAYFNTQTDTLMFVAVEQNPDHHTSKVYAQVLNSKDEILSETPLTQTDSTYDGSLNLNSLPEDFYKVRYRQSGIDIPSNLYFSNEKKLRFTTAGPVVLDSIIWKKTPEYYSVKVHLKNKSAVASIPTPSVKLICNNIGVQPITNNIKSLSGLSPGKSVNTSFIVRTVDTLFNGSFNFKVEIRSNGYAYWTDSTKVNVTAIEEGLQKTTFNLEQNFPNPFNLHTTIGWQLAHGDRATLSVFDLVGRKVAILVDEYRSPGRYETSINASTLPKGIYFYQLKAGKFIQAKKMIVVK